MIFGPVASGCPTDRAVGVRRDPRSPLMLAGQARPFRDRFTSKISKNQKTNFSGYRIYCVGNTLSIQNLVARDVGDNFNLNRVYAAKCYVIC